MSARSYLSIGDVLTLLRQEFPDITISKIRFLESQGLVNPERTPSGYRKFYDQDVERLRWVLRQQREHFLPLKVIKDRLDEDASIIYANGDAPAGEGEAGREPVLAGRTAGAAEAASVSASAGSPSTPVPPPPAVPSAASVPPEPAAAAPSSPTTSSAAGDEPPLPGLTHAASASSEANPAPTAPTPARPGADRGRTAAATDGSAPPPDETASTEHRPASAAAAAPARATMATTTSDGTGETRFSPDELAEASGLVVADIEALVEFGLLTPMLVAGLPTYDGHALAVAQAAAAFARFGVEPRHLRLYKVAADREAGFIEQIVVPLVRQRNPDARARAEATATELAELGQRLRAALLEVVLGPTLRG